MSGGKSYHNLEDGEASLDIITSSDKNQDNFLMKSDPLKHNYDESIEMQEVPG